MPIFDEIEISESDYEQLKRMSNDMLRIQSLIGSEGAKLITVEWLAEKWGFRREDSAFNIDDFTVRVHSGSSLRYDPITLDFRYGSATFDCPPQTRDDFRLFAKFFGLEENK